MARRTSSQLAVALVLLPLLSCGGGGGGNSGSTYTVTYSGNGATSGSAPVDSSSYAAGATVTVLGNTGGLAETGHVFGAWNTQANGSGTSYASGQTFVMGSANVTLYAQWTIPSGYTVTYDGNGATLGSVPVDSGRYGQSQSVTVAGNTGALAYPGYAFIGWQAKADGSGTAYRPGGTFQMGTANVTLYALWAGGYAYAVNQSGGGAGTVSQYVIGPNGALTAMSTPTIATGGNNSQRAAVDPAGKYVYVVNVSGNTVSQFTIGSNGALSAMATPTISMGPGPGIYYPFTIAVHPTSKWAYVAINQRSYLEQFTIGSDGALSAMTPASVPAGAYPDTVTVHPSGKYAYVSNGDGHNISQYTVDQTTGALSAMTPATVPAGQNAWSIVVDPSGRYAYSTDYFQATVYQYTIDQTTGALSPNTPATVATGTVYSGAIAVDPAGKYVYVGNPGGGSSAAVVAQFKIGTDGTLTSIGTVAAGGAAVADIATVRITSGDYAYATSGNTGWGSTSIAQYKINQATGALEILANATVQAGSWPNGIVATGLH
jgi:6-phosphogluconolactonase (cycloisomerase 2 family)